MIQLGNESYYKCSCYSHILHIYRDEEDGELSIEIFKMSGDFFHRSLWSRIKIAWQFLKSSTHSADNVILTKRQALGLSQDIQRLYEEEGIPEMSWTE